jgi:glucose-1-phosphate adenylyltransferase
MPDATDDTFAPLTTELKDTLTLILAGGQGSRLKPLTEGRAKPAVPFGGTYRIIDFTLSNCIHSGLRRIYVLTQYRARSLDEHIRFGWNFLPRRLEQFISVRPPHHQGQGKWYEGTADAIFHNRDTLRQERPRHVVILSGDHIYKMDYGRMLREHIDNGAALTIGAVRIPVADCRHFGIFETEVDGRVVSFEEKPEHGKEVPGDPGHCLASMGIYIFETEDLVRRLEEDAALGNESSHDFGKDVIPRMIGESPVFAHHFRSVDGAETPYWRDVGTLDAYYDANLDLCSVEPQCNLYDTSWPIFTLWHNNPPAKTVLSADVTDSLLCSGTVVSGGTVSRSLLSERCYVSSEAKVEESILLSGVNVGRGARVRRAIVDKWVEIPEGAEVGIDAERDAERFPVTEAGIVVVPTGYRF